ncbi:MAG: alkaline phosphatase family protein, partial [Candidatus Binatia bacterium]
MRRSARLVCAAGVVAALFMSAACSRAPEPSVLLVGLDGASWTVIERLLRTNELPTFARLLREGAHTPSFGTLEPTRSPALWTSVATGRQPQDHGILDFTETLPSGQRIPVTNLGRKVPAIWEIASREGLRVGVVSWWGSWPAESVDGYFVTDRANPAMTNFWVEDKNFWTAPASAAEPGRDFLPVDLAPILEREWIARDPFPFDDVARRSKISAEQLRLLREAPWNERTRYSLFKTYYAVDYPLFSIAKRLLRERPTALQLLYLRGPDPLQHYAWDLIEPEKFRTPPVDAERDRGLVEGIYRTLDGLLAELLAAKRPETWLVVMSDHGFEPMPESVDDPNRTRSGAHTVKAKGVFFVVGPHVKPGARIAADAGLLDVMPTVAWLLGLPISEELPGRVLEEAFDESFVESRPARRIPAYGARTPSVGLP